MVRTSSRVPSQLATFTGQESKGQDQRRDSTTFLQIVKRDKSDGTKYE